MIGKNKSIKNLKHFIFYMFSKTYDFSDLLMTIF